MTIKIALVKSGVICDSHQLKPTVTIYNNGLIYDSRADYFVAFQISKEGGGGGGGATVVVKEAAGR